MPGFLANIVALTKKLEVVLAKWSAADHSHMNTTVPFVIAGGRVSSFDGTTEVDETDAA